MRGVFETTHRYEIVRKIAEGGMGSVYEARQVGAGGFRKRVAIKTLLPEFCHDSRLVAMFVDEARLVADLVHENIVQIYQLGQIDGEYFIVMELVAGISLEDFIALHRLSGQALPRELAVFIVSRIARGLAYAHSRQGPDGRALEIVHRDVCPNNILVTTEGLPKLTDFGIARAVNTFSASNEHALMGKLAYMAPEQARKEHVDFRADIYSLGLVLLELLTLRRVRNQKSAEALRAAARAGWVDWGKAPQTLEPDLLAILKKMLATDPDKRYRATDDLGHDLEYHIYHKGYGPTVVTLEKYLRKHFPGLYTKPRAGPTAEGSAAITGKTMRIDPSSGFS